MRAFDTPKPDDRVWKILTAIIVYPLFYSAYFTFIYVVGRTVTKWLGL